MSALTETELVEAVRQGRREGQTEMVSRYAERVFAMIARQVPDMMDAQELTQDTFLRAFSHIDSYNPHKASLSTWLCRIAYHLTLYYFEDRPLAEITYITGIEPAALANRLYRTRKKLYRKLNN